MPTYKKKEGWGVTFVASFLHRCDLDSVRQVAPVLQSDIISWMTQNVKIMERIDKLSTALFSIEWDIKVAVKI